MVLEVAAHVGSKDHGDVKDPTRFDIDLGDSGKILRMKAATQDEAGMHFYMYCCILRVRLHAFKCDRMHAEHKHSLLALCVSYPTVVLAEHWIESLLAWRDYFLMNSSIGGSVGILALEPGGSDELV